MCDVPEVNQELIIENNSLKKRVCELEELLSKHKHYEEVLKEIENTYRFLLKNTTDYVARYNSDGVLMYAADAIYGINGYKPEEIIGTSGFDRVHPDDKSRARAALRDAFKFEKERKFEYRIMCKDGSYKWVEMSGKVIHSSETGQKELIAVTRDITERKRGEEALRESEEKYRELFSRMPSGVAIYEAVNGEDDFVFLDLNTAAESIECVRKEDVIGRRVTEVFPGVRDFGIFALFQRVWKTGKPEFFPMAMYRDDRDPGTWRESWVYRLPSGNIVAIYNNITDRKRAEEALRENEEQYRSLFDTSTQGILIYNRTGIIQMVNPAMMKLLGAVSPEKVVGRKYLDFIHPDDREKSAARIEKIFQIASDNPDKVSVGQVAASLREHRLIRINGDIVDVESTGVAFMYQNSVYLQGIFIDISERKQAKEALIEKNRELEEAYLVLKEAQERIIMQEKMEAIGQLAGGIAHDFNNMLAVILGNLEMAMDQIEPDNQLKVDLAAIEVAARHSADLTRQLLAYACKQMIFPVLLDTNKTVAGTLDMIQRLIGENIQLVWSPGENIWPVKMDPSQINQVISNLCVNARDAITGTGRITVETGNITFDEDYCAEHEGFVTGDYVLLSISDDGCGMKKEVLAKAFDPFFTTKDVGKGTGMGLSTVYGVVKQNKGFINIYSEPDIGTTCKIYLPRETGNGKPAETGEHQKALLTGGETILLVEDEKELLAVGKKILERLGYKVLVADKPAMAIQMAEVYADKIDLLLTDLIMPEMSGWDLAGQLLSRNPNLKILYTSGYPLNMISHHYVLDEGLNFISKPFSKRDLATKIRKILDQR